MVVRNRLKLYYLGIAILLVAIIVVPSRVSGEVKPIEEAQKKLKGITEEEQKTLEKLFTLTQEIEEMEREEVRLTGEIDKLQTEIKGLDQSIDKEQKKYETELGILEQVLISYQRGGPASYLEILLKAENLKTFLKSINLIKDISRNVGELLDTIEQSRQKLIEEKDTLAVRALQLEAKKEELKEPIENKQRLKREQETYLDTLAEEKVRYEEHLGNLETMWKDLRDMFSEIVEEFSRIIGEGYFTMEDLNIRFSFLSVKGSVHEDTFNKILKEHSTLPEIVFHFNTDKIVLEVPDKNLVLEGSFTVYGNSALKFEVESGSFYQMPLEPESIEELFREGPLIIDFEAVAGELVTIDINLDQVEALEGNLNFTIKIGFPF